MKRLNRVRALFGFLRTKLPARLGVPVAFAPEQGKRLFAVVGLGASLGGALGAYVTTFLTDVVALGTYELLLVAGALLVACALLTQLAHRREQGRVVTAKAEHGGEGGFTMVLRNPYLLYIALFSLVFSG